MEAYQALAKVYDKIAPQCKKIRFVSRAHGYDVYKYDKLTNKSIFLYKTCLDETQKRDVIEDAKNSVSKKQLESLN